MFLSLKDAKSSVSAKCKKVVKGNLETDFKDFITALHFLTPVGKMKRKEVIDDEADRQ